MSGPRGAPAPDEPWPVRDLDVVLTPAPSGDAPHGAALYRVWVAYEPTHLERSGTTVAPLSASDVEDFTDVLTRARGTRGISRSVVREDRLSLIDLAERLGQRLFDALFAGERLRVFAAAAENARGQGARLRLRLRLDAAPALARLPWELLRDGQDFLSVTDDHFVTRFQGSGRTLNRPSLAGALRVLVVAASPSDVPEVSVEAEVAALMAEVRPLVEAGAVAVHRLEPPTLAALQDALKEPWHVIHFIGHGEAGVDGAHLVLATPEGTSDPVDAKVLGLHVSGSPHLRLAVLNGCQTATTPLLSPRDGVALRLVNAGVPAAVAMQFPVADTSAVRFARYLYRTLAEGDVVDRAVAEGRQTLLDTPDWVNPVLYLGADGRLFDRPAPPSAPTPPAGRQPGAGVPPGLVPGPERFVARGWIAREVERWLGSDARVLLLTGDYGAGTSVACGWLAGVGAAPEDPADAEALATARASWHAVVFCSASLVGAVTSPRAFVLRLAEHLARAIPGFVLDTGTAAGVPNDLVSEGVGLDDLVVRALETPLRRALRQDGPPVVVLVDGLDEAARTVRPTICDLLARLAVLDVPLKFALAGPNDPALLRPFTRLRPAPTRVDLSGPEHGARSAADVRTFLDQALPAAPEGPGPAEDDAPHHHLRARIAALAAGNFLYAENVVATIEAGDSSSVSADRVPPSLADTYDIHLRGVLALTLGERWREQWADTLAPVLAFLAVARAPVPVAALQAWLGWTRPRLTAVLDGFSQIVRSERDTYRIYHPAFAAHLRNPVDAGALAVDAEEADRTIVDATIHLSDADLERATETGGSYRLVHAPAHLAPRSGAVVDGARLDALTARMLTPAYLAALNACVKDPVDIGEAYRTLATLLIAARRWTAVQDVVRFVGQADVSAVRACVLDVLVTYADADPAGAQAFITRLALGDSGELASGALHATGRLAPAAQAEVFRRVVEAGDEERRLAAGYALFANGLSDPGVLRGVLEEMIRTLPITQPWRLRTTLGFFAHVTIANYISACHDPAVTRLTADLYRDLLVGRLHLRTLDNALLARLVSEVLAYRLSTIVLEPVTGPVGPEGREQVGSHVPGADEARRVLPALDPLVPLDPVEDDLLFLLGSDALLLRILGALALGIHAVREPGPTAALARRLQARAGARARRWLLLAHAVVLPDTPQAWVGLLEDLTRDLVVAGPPAPDPADTFLDASDLRLVPLVLAYAKARTPMTVLEEILRSPQAAPWRPSCLAALGAVGLHRPTEVLASVDRLLESGVLTAPDATAALALIAGVHPLQVRSWVLAHSGRDLLSAVEKATHVQVSRRYLDLLGLYNNAVHQCLAYPKMRRGIATPVFTRFLESTSRRQWSRRYTADVIAMLREADYDLLRWVD